MAMNFYICNIVVSFGLVFVQHYTVFAADSPCRQATDCSECMQIDPRCGWCLDNEFLVNSNQSRCDLRSVLIKEPMPLCSNMTSTFSQSNISSDEKFSEEIQVRPKTVSVRLRPGQPATFNVSVKPAPNFPVDIYFLVDASFSMERLISNISKLADAIASSINVITKNYRLAYGTFVDKDVVPFTEGPRSPKFPCNFIQKSNCEAVFPYRHLLDFTKDTTLFQQRVNKSKLSGDFDTAEGGFDALMQLAACDEMIGWRPKEKSRRIVLFVSDALPKIAGDGQLIGGLVQNDGKCHLSPLEKDRKILTYNASKTMDYPSLSQLRIAMEEAGITPIIAANPTVFEIYKNIADTWSTVLAAVGKLKDDSNNIVDLVRDNYQKISSLVRFDDTSFDDNLKFDYKPLSPKCFGTVNKDGCPGVGIGDQVDFEVSIKAEKCPNDLTRATKRGEIKIPGFGAVQIDMEYLCECECSSAAQKNSSQCSKSGTLECAICKCNEGFYGESCKCDELSSINITNTLQSCVSYSDDKTTTICNNQGSCVCGKCVCYKNQDPLKKISGPLCECKNFGCNCRGRGECVCGTCKCKEQFTGENCENCIDVKKDICGKNGVLFSNEDCTHKCICNPGYEGEFCEHSVGSKCIDYGNCTLCRLLNRTDVKCTGCENYNFIEVGCGIKPCTKEINATHSVYFLYNTNAIIDTDTRNVTIYWSIGKDNGCPGALTGEDNPNLVAVIAGTIAAIVFIGLLLLLLWKLLLLLQGRREYLKFESSKGQSQWGQDDNPIYVEPDQKFENPVFNAHID